MQIFNPEPEYDGREAILLTGYTIDGDGRIHARVAIIEASGDGPRVFTIRLPLAFTVENKDRLYRGRIITGTCADKGIKLQLGGDAPVDALTSLPA